MTAQDVRDQFAAGLAKRMAAAEMARPELVRLVAEQLEASEASTDRQVRRWLAAQVEPRPKAKAALCVVLGCSPRLLYAVQR